MPKDERPTRVAVQIPRELHADLVRYCAGPPRRIMMDVVAQAVREYLAAKR